MAVVLQTLGERATDTRSSRGSAGDLPRIRSRSSSARRTISTGRPPRTISATCCWRSASARTGSKLLEEAVAAFRADAREARPRQGAARLGRDAEQYRHRAVQSLSEREAGTERLVEAEAAYRLALEEYTRDKAPVQWAMVQNNLGNTLNALGTCQERHRAVQAGGRGFPRCDGGEDARQLADAMGGEPAQSRQHAEQYRQVRDTARRASTRRRAPSSDALTVFTRETDAVRLGVGQEQSRLGAADARPAQQRRRQAGGRRPPRSARRMQEYTRARVPLDWAMANLQSRQLAAAGRPVQERSRPR